MENGIERFLPSRHLDTAAGYYLASSLCHLIVIDIIEGVATSRLLEKGFQFHRERFLPPRHLDTAAGAA